MPQFIRKLLQKIVQHEPDPIKLNRSIAIGIFMAFTPYLGLQTWIGIALAYFTRSNIAVVTIVLYAVNNPWTMIPIAALDYMVGRLVTESLLGFDLLPYNPLWMNWVNSKIGFLTNYLGIEQISLWCFLIGGTILALIAGIISYFALKSACKTFVQKYGDQS